MVEKALRMTISLKIKSQDLQKEILTRQMKEKSHLKMNQIYINKARAHLTQKKLRKVSYIFIFNLYLKNIFIFLNISFQI